MWSCSSRRSLHQAIQESTWEWFLVRIGLVAAPLSETIERGGLTDLETEFRLKRFQMDCSQAALDLSLGTGLMAMRSILEGCTEPDHPKQVAKIILKSLGVAEVEADAIAFKSISPF